MELPVWRSLLYVPANVAKFVASAADRGADGVILDLEDSVAPAQKPAARGMLADAVAQAGGGGGVA
jgi:citrate lyase subunit beta/citryl-CoA lyase